MIFIFLLVYECLTGINVRYTIPPKIPTGKQFLGDPYGYPYVLTKYILCI